MMIIRNNKEWLERQLGEWQEKGWLTAEGAQHIRKSVSVPANSGLAMPVYGLLAIVACSLAGMGLIWGAAYTWYHVSMAVRMGLAVMLLLFSQVSIGLAMFQQREGSLLGEGVGLAHCLTVFAALAMTEQTFYVGWYTTTYIAVCALLILPAAYLLRSIGTVLVYELAVLVWAALGGPMYTPGGIAGLWLLIVLITPYYYTALQQGNEWRLSVFSWSMTITVFAAFALMTQNAAYIPFLLLSALAVAIMLTGYSIDIRKSWGVPFRWFGRFAAAASLLISCMPAAWDGIAAIQGFHWSTTAITVGFMVLIVALLAKGVKKRLWGPVIYAVIPFMVGAETVLVRSGLYSSVPLILSSAYLLFLGFYETMQGIKGSNRISHLRFGILLLVSLIASFVVGTSFSPLVPVLAIVILTLVIVQFRRTSESRKAAAVRAARRARMKHTAATVRQDSPSQPESSSDVPQAADPIGIHDAASDADTLSEWMRQLHVPSPDAITVPVQEQQESRPAQGIHLHETAHSAFVPPVFHSPDDMPLPSAATWAKQKKEPAKAPSQSGHTTTSPWQSMAAPAKREKRFSRSPWAKEGESK